MPSRRAYLAAGGTTLAVALAGCGTADTQDPPAGSLRFENRHNLPHQISIAVTGAGAERGEERGTVTGEPEGLLGQPSFTATTVLDPETDRMYEDVFTAAVYYAVRHTVDGDVPEHSPARIAFNPAPPDRDRGSILGVEITQDGAFGWTILSTDNPGPFTR